MCMSIKFSVLMRLQGPGISTFQQLARSGRNMLAPTFGQWQANGRLLLQTVLSISMAVVSALAMMDRTPGHRKSEVVHHGPGTEIPSMMITRSSCASFGKHKSPVSTLCSSSREARDPYIWQRGRWGSAGSTGRGRQKMWTNGAIKLVSILGGSRGIPTSDSIQAFAVRGIRKARQPIC